jgi:hypothetical protein
MRKKLAERLRLHRETVISLDHEEALVREPRKVVGGRPPNSICECSENGCISRAAD